MAKATATSELRLIRRHAERIKNDETHTIGTMSPGDAWAQGDLLIVALAGLPAGAQPAKLVRQLAPGTSQGSRHTIAPRCEVSMYRVADPSPLDGPVFRSAGAIEVEHPEHGNVILPAGTYGVVYQRQFAEELKRVLD